VTPKTTWGHAGSGRDLGAFEADAGELGPIEEANSASEQHRGYVGFQFFN
jgi:hypothetical protein